MEIGQRERQSDGDLLEQYRAGDDAALARLLERHAPSVHRFGLKMCRDPEDAKDVLQDTLLAAARGAREFRGASSLSTWLYTIARSFCIKKRRRVAPASTSLDDEGALHVASPAAAPDDAAAARELGAALEQAIGALEPMYREVLLLRDVEGLSAQEVAQVLGVGVDAVKSRLHRARAAVRARMAPLLSPNVEPPAPSCPDVVSMLSRYLEGEIGPEQCKELDRHVAGCARCRTDCDSLRRVLALCQQESQEQAMPPDVKRLVETTLRALAAQPPPP
jgi:RNA polymerase sigma-70 factor, ECF subfamily